MSKQVAWVACALVALAAPAFAQGGDDKPVATPPAQVKPAAPAAAAKVKPASPVTPAAAAAAPPAQTVTVTAKASAYQSSIDRRSYSVANDLQKAAGGSMADILRNVPSVEVDVQGNVSLRGNSSVTILIDGQPSALMKGGNRSDVLQQLPADQIERVEVMTNPSAAFTPEGTGGIINLITKKSAKNTPKTTGSIKASVGTGGRYNASASRTYSVNGLTLTGSGGFRHGGNANDGSTTQQLVDPVSGTMSQSRSTFVGKSYNDSGSARGAVDYDLDSQTRLSGEVSFFGGRFQSNTTGAYSSNAMSGIGAKNYNSIIGDIYRFHDYGGAVTLLRKLGGDDHEISVRLSSDDFVNATSHEQRLDYVDPGQADIYQGLYGRDEGVTSALKAEYKGPLPGQAKLVAGYELNLDQQGFDHQGVLGASSGTAIPVAGLIDNFKATQAVHALYATYQRPFGAFTVMPGLRLEDVVIDLVQVTQQIKGSQSYFRAYPTLHLAYKLDDNRQITASYSQRVQRPGLQSLDPFRVYNSPLSYSQGYSQLQPQTTDAYELGYEFRQKSTYYLATLYYRDNRKQFTQIQQDIGGGVILSTQANLGHSRSAGLELVANGDLLKTLSYNVSGNAYWNEIDPGSLTLASSRSGATTYGRISLNWTPTPKDFFQLNFNGRSKALSGQGYYAPTTGLNLGYRHKFDDRLAFVATANDPFDQSRFGNFIDTPNLKQQSRNSYHQRALFLGFTYALGTAKTRASEGFDFNSGGSGGK